MPLFSGEPGRVDALIDKAMRLNPYYPFYYILYRGQAYLAMARYPEALEALRRSVAHKPDALPPHVYLAACLGLLGEHARAREALADARRIYPLSRRPGCRASCRTGGPPMRIGSSTVSVTRVWTGDSDRRVGGARRRHLPRQAMS